MLQQIISKQTLCVLCVMLVGLSACSFFKGDTDAYEDVYHDDTKGFSCDKEHKCSDILVAHLTEEDGTSETVILENKMPATTVETKIDGNMLSGDNLPLFNAAGVRYCPNRRRCTGEKLPPQPCAQPMPRYYGNIESGAAAQGIELIHPFTRTKVICYDQQVKGTAVDCANIFRADGYVLVTDIPQVPAKYDLLRAGTYPTRRWRGGGEVVPRW